ncbi:MAG: 4-alpha-glucanotransferase, partial [Candidatus Omnitrophica bacterium]|nr:4-alpha-glucanotransferase [Candidatus Omnitrophota bacterium]
LLLANRTYQGKESCVFGTTYRCADFSSQQEAIEFLLYEQFVGFEQLYALLLESAERGIHVLGDLPFYRAQDGVDVAYRRHYFVPGNTVVQEWLILQAVRLSVLKQIEEGDAVVKASTGEGQAIEERYAPYAELAKQMQQFLPTVEQEAARIGNFLPQDLRTKLGIEVMPGMTIAELLQVEPPGFKGGSEQIWGNLAAWNEPLIDHLVKQGEKDPRTVPFKFWQNVFSWVMGDTKACISGWRLDALHMYGRGAYRDGAERLVFSTALWDSLAEFFTRNKLLAIVEQLGADGFAFEHFKKLGFIQYAFILDLKPKELEAFVADLSGISRGIAFVVADTHDSQRWAREYSGMFTLLANAGLPSEQHLNRQEALGLLGPAFLGLLSLGPRMETTLLSLGEYATEEPIKIEMRNEKGVVTGTRWGTGERGKFDFRSWLRRFAQIRKENPAVAHSNMIPLAFEEVTCGKKDGLVAFVKAHSGNNLVCLANFSSLGKRIQAVIPAAEVFNIYGALELEFKDLVNGGSVKSNGHAFEYSLSPGQIAVFRLESTKTKLHHVLNSRSPQVQADNQQIKLVHWDWDNKNREVMITHDGALVMRNQFTFLVRCASVDDASRPEETFAAGWNQDIGQHEVFISELPSGRYTMQVFWSMPGVTQEHATGESQTFHLRVLPSPQAMLATGEPAGVSLRLSHKQISSCEYRHNSVTLANGIGSILRMPLRGLTRNWHNQRETLGYTSKYDGFQASLLLRVPDEQRRVLFRGATEVAGITLADGSTREFNLDLESLEHFELYPLATWVFVLEFKGEKIKIAKTAALKEGTNTFVFNYILLPVSPNVKSVDLFVRPELEQRLHHETTKAGGFEYWNSKHQVIERNGQKRGFVIHALNEQWRQWYPGFEGTAMVITDGEYTFSPEWRFACNPIEKERGQDDYSDAYSPGFFHARLDANQRRSASLQFISVDCHYQYGRPYQLSLRHNPFQAYISGLTEGEYDLQFFWPETNKPEAVPYRLVISGCGEHQTVHWNWDAKDSGVRMRVNDALFIEQAHLFYVTTKNRATGEMR